MHLSGWELWIGAALLLFGVTLLAAGLLHEFRITRRRRSQRLISNAEAIVGKRVKILQLVSEKADGVVLLSGEHWKARSLAGAGDLPSGSEAQIVERDGLCLLLIPIER
jgi:membrane protein implicated in regulation of membrane protease activity